MEDIINCLYKPLMSLCATLLYIYYTKVSDESPIIIVSYTIIYVSIIMIIYNTIL